MMDKTLDALTKLLSGDSGDPDVTALSEAIKARLGITTPLAKPEASPSPGVKTLADTLMGDRHAHKLPEVGSCPSPFHPRIRTVPVTSLEETPEEDLTKLGLTSLAPLAKEPPPLGATGRKPIAQANISLDLPKFDPKNLPEWAEEFQEFLPLTGQANTDVETKCSLIRKSCKKRYLQREVKMAIKRCRTSGEVLQCMFSVCETDLSVRTAIEELPMLPEFPSAARISEFVCDLEYLFSRLNPGSFGPTEPHLWLVGKISPKTWEDCRSNSERKRRTHTYDELVQLVDPRLLVESDEPLRDTVKRVLPDMLHAVLAVDMHRCVVEGAGVRSKTAIFAEALTTFTVVSHRTAGGRIATGGLPFAAVVRPRQATPGAATQTTAAEIVDNGDGTYRGQYSTCTTGAQHRTLEERPILSGYRWQF